MSFKSLLPTLNSIPGSGSNQSIRYASSFAGLSNLVSRVVGRKSVEAPVVSEGLFEELAESQAKIPTISEKRIASFVSFPFLL